MAAPQALAMERPTNLVRQGIAPQRGNLSASQISSRRRIVKQAESVGIEQAR